MAGEPGRTGDGGLAMRVAWRGGRPLRGRPVRQPGICILLTVLLVICLPAGAATVYARDCTIPAPGESGECVIVLDEVSAGLSEFEVTVRIEDPHVGTITSVKFPSFARLNSRSKVPAGSVTLKGADTNNIVRPGDRNVILATLGIRGDAAGTTPIQVTVLGMKDDGGTPYTVPGMNGRLVVLPHNPVSGNGDVTDTAGSLPFSDINGPPGGHSGDLLHPGDAESGPVNTEVPTQTLTPTPTPTMTPTPTPTPSPTPTPTLTVTATPTSSPTPTLTPTPTPTPSPTPTPTLTVTRTPTPSPTPTMTPTLTPTPSPTPTPTLTVTPTPTLSPTLTPTQPVTPAPATTTAPASDLCSLCLESDPASALVTIDGIERGVTPICVPLAPGTHRITISKEGYVPWEGEITTGASQTLSLPVFSLRPVARFVVEAGCSPGGAVLPEGPVRVPKGGTVEFLFVPETGYELVDVLVDGRSIGPHPRTRLEGISRNHTVRGVFSPVTPSSPVAAILANSTDGVAPLAVQFQDVSEGDVANRSWDFGDGTSSTDPSPVHVFYEPGNYTVTLGVCGRGGCNLSAPSCLIVVREGNTGGNGTSGESGGGGVTPGADDDNPPLIGGSTGFLRVRCPVEGASVFIDGDYRGEIRNGTLDILIYLTGTPCRAVTVKAPGYLPATAPVSRYPAEGETVVIEVAPILIGPSPGVFEGPVRSSPLPGNVTPTIPSLSSG